MSQNYLASRSSNLSSFNAIAMNYSTLTVSTLSGVSTLNVSRVITTSTIQVNSSMISLGASTNQVYVSSLSYGNFSTATIWVTSMTNLLSTATIAMSANAQYQMTVSPSTTVSSIMYTSTLGSSWTTISAATGLPSATATSYTAGAISGTGQYGVLGTNNNNLYTTTNYGQSWTNTNLSTITVYLPFDTVPASAGTYADTTGRSAVTYTGPPTQAPSYVTGTGAVRLANATPGGVSSQYIQGTWGNVGLTSFTISFWFNIQSYGANASYIFSAYNGALAVVTAQTSNNLVVNIPITASPYYATFTTPSPIAPVVNTWYNITIIYQSSGTCYLYLNNALYGTIAGAGLSGGTQTNKFGISGFDSTPGTSASFNGYIDDLKIYNYAIFTLPSPLSLTYSSVAVSNSGQYMLATVTNGGLFMSSNFGSTWTQVTGATLNAIWSNVQVSASGQYMLVYAQPIIVQPQLTGLTGNNTTSTPVATSWQTNGITWTSNSSSVVTSTFQSWCAFNNVVPPNSSSPSYSWASAGTYNTANGAYTGSVSTTIISPGPGAYTGEWIQIQSSVPIVIYSYNFACAGPVNIPKTYFIIGSNDGTNWYPIQSVSIGTNPFTISFTSATSSPIIVNQSGSQTMTAGTSGTLTCTTYTTNTTAAYTYFRFIANTVFQTSGVFEFAELYLTFQAAGQTYSTNYGATWNNGYALPTPTALSLSGSGQYAIGANNSTPSAPVVYVTNNFLQGFSTGTFTTPTFQTPLGTGNNPVASAVSNTGQYMVVITNNISGNNVYYSTNFGALFTGLQLGTTLLTSCAISYDGSYITVSNATTTWTLNNNSNGFSLALGNQAGYQNQGQNAIAIGNGAGSINQTANSIILNASGAAVNSFAPGFYVAPIASYTASSSGSYNLLGYGTDNQVVQTGITVLPNAQFQPFTIRGLSTTLATTLTLTNSLGSNVQFISGLTAVGMNNISQAGDFGIINLDTQSNLTPYTLTAGIVLAGWNASAGLRVGPTSIQMSGNVGIGTTAPTTTLHVSGASNTYLNGQLFISDANSPGNQLRLYSYWGGADDNSFTSIQSRYNSAVSLLKINPSGGIVTIGPATFGQLSVGTGSTSGIALVVNSPTIYGNGTVNITAPSSGVRQDCMTCTAVIDTNFIISFYSANGTFRGKIGGVNASSISYDTSSDRRLKTNISPITNAVQLLQQLQPVNYTWIQDQTPAFGFIAQDVYKVIPQFRNNVNSYTGCECTGTMNCTCYPDDEPVDSDGKPIYYGLDYGKFTPYLVKAIQEQQQTIQQQSIQITALESTLTTQQAQLTAITQRLAAANIA